MSQQSTKKEIKTIKLSPSLLLAGATCFLALSIAISTFVIRKHIDNTLIPAIDRQLGYIEQQIPRIATMDMEAITEDLKRGSVEETSRAYMAMSVFMKMVEQDGVMLFNRKHTLTPSKYLHLDHFDVDLVMAEAQTRGIQVDEAVEEAVSAAQRKAEEQVAQMEALMRQLEEQAAHINSGIR